MFIVCQFLRWPQGPVTQYSPTSTSACGKISVSLGFSSDLWNNALMLYCTLPWSASVLVGGCVYLHHWTAQGVCLLVEHTAGTMREGVTKVVCMCVCMRACVHLWQLVWEVGILVTGFWYSFLKCLFSLWDLKCYFNLYNFIYLFFFRTQHLLEHFCQKFIL